MTPTNAYKQQQALALTRIEMLLALYEGAIERLKEANFALTRGDRRAATPLLLRSQRIVAELMAGLDLSFGELPRNLQRLYGFVLRAIGSGTTQEIESALRVLCILHEGLLVIRSEAIELERRGIIPSIDRVHVVEASV